MHLDRGIHHRAASRPVPCNRGVRQRINFCTSSHSMADRQQAREDHQQQQRCGGCLRKRADAGRAFVDSTACGLETACCPSSTAWKRCRRNATSCSGCDRGERDAPIRIESRACRFRTATKSAGLSRSAPSSSRSALPRPRAGRPPNNRQHVRISEASADVDGVPPVLTM
jgi:hypothetical protein